MILTRPTAEPNGFIKTLNNMGYMTSTCDPFTEEFVEFSRSQRKPVLDIGAAYGIATKKALAVGAAVIANDIDARHLEILANEVEVEQIASDSTSFDDKSAKKVVTEKNGSTHHSRLTLLPGDLNEIQVSEKSVSAILVCRVLHFFTGPQIESVARKLYQWLESGGRIFIVAETPYLKNFENFIPIYENRKRQGVEWPGFIDDVMAVAPERGEFLPRQMHLLDPDVLKCVFESAGFKTVKCNTIARTDFPEDIQLDGRESVGYIGEK